jgi:hypothetical protein
MCQQESTSLKLAQNDIGGLTCRGDSDGFQQSAGLAFEVCRVQEVLVCLGRDPS